MQQHANSRWQRSGLYLYTPLPAPGQVLELPDAGKDELQAAWKQWMQEAGKWVGGRLAVGVDG